MKKILTIAILALAISSCATSARMVVVSRPEPPVMVRPVSPYPGWIWLGGEWMWRRGGYVYRPGYWVAPRVGYVWQRGHWSHLRRGWRWVGGHWRAI